jgi:DNA-binding NarL/FixJ family response regulator
MIRVAIFNNDNNAKFQKHLVNLLKREPDINVVAQTETGMPGIKVVEEQKPDVVLIDSKQPFTENLESTERIVSRFQDTKIIFLSSSSEDSLTASTCLVGACFPFRQNCTDRDILAAIREGL